MATTYQAQTEFRTTYTSDDGTFSFQYDDNLSVDVAPAQTSLSVGEFFVSPDDPIRITVAAPTNAETFAANGLGNTPETIIAARLALWHQTAPAETGQVIALPDPRVFHVPLAPVNTYMINGRPAAYAMQVIPVGPEHAAAVILVAVDVGQNHMVTITASPSLRGGGRLIADYRDDVLAIAETLTFIPTLDDGRGEALPLSSEFANEVGSLQTGELTFYYPKPWYILPVAGNIFITNIDRLMTGELEPGIVQVNVIPPDFNLTGFADVEQVEACTLTPDQQAMVTPVSVLEQQMLSEERLESYAQQEATYFEPESIMLNGHDAAYMRLFTPERDVLVIAVNVGMGHVVSLMSFSPSGEMATYDDTLFAIAATLDYQHIGCVE